MQASSSSDSLDGSCVDYAKSYAAVVFGLVVVLTGLLCGPSWDPSFLPVSMRRRRALHPLLGEYSPGPSSSQAGSCFQHLAFAGNHVLSFEMMYMLLVNVSAILIECIHCHIFKLFASFTLMIAFRFWF
jgi:hypothetical protein